MKPPVLVVAPAAEARRIADALGDAFAVSTVGDPARARALAATGFHRVTIAADVFADVVDGAVTVGSEDDSAALIGALHQLLTDRLRDERADAHVASLSALAFDEFTELAHAAATRRYLIGLLHHHRGSVTDAARAAGMARESLHRLLRRHHLDADDFRDRDG
jgi:hypothetical protein